MLGEQTVFSNLAELKTVKKGQWIVILGKEVETVEEKVTIVNGKEKLVRNKRKTPKSFTFVVENATRLEAKKEAEHFAKVEGMVVENVYKLK